MARYADAINWIAINDDTLWVLDEENGHLSVTAALVADLFGKTDEQVTKDLRKRLTEIHTTDTPQSEGAK